MENRPSLLDVNWYCIDPIHHYKDTLSSLFHPIMMFFYKDSESLNFT